MMNLPDSDFCPICGDRTELIQDRQSDHLGICFDCAHDREEEWKKDSWDRLSEKERVEIIRSAMNG